MVFGMDTDSVSPEENNLLRLIYVIKKPCTECLRHVLKINIPSCYADIKNAVSSERIKLQGIFTKTQNSRIFPQNQLCPNFDISICDMTLLYTLIRNVSLVNPPTTGWDKPVNNQPRDHSIGANVERLRVLRNSIIHEERHDITDSEFNNFWSDIEASLADIDQSLGNTRFQQDLIYLRTLNLDTKFVKEEITKIRTRKYFQELKEGQKEQMVVIDEVNNKTTKIEDHVCRNAEQIGELKDIMIKIQHQVSRNAVQRVMGYVKVTEPQEVERCKGIQRLSLEEFENTDRINQKCMIDMKIPKASYIRSQHNEAYNQVAPTDATKNDTSGEKDILDRTSLGFWCLCALTRGREAASGAMIRSIGVEIFDQVLIETLEEIKDDKLKKELYFYLSRQLSNRLLQSIKTAQFIVWPGTILSNEEMVYVLLYKGNIEEIPRRYFDKSVFYRDSEKTAQNLKYPYRRPKIVTNENNGLTYKDAVLIERAIEEHGEDLFLNHSNLEAISGSSFILSKSRGYIRHPCVVLYCQVKGIAPYGERTFPKTLQIGDDTLAVDVREGFLRRGMLQPESRDCRYNKLQMGISIGAMDLNLSGTLGPFVNLDGGDVGFLTCAHVVEGGTGHIGHPANGESLIDIDPSERICGEVMKIVFNPKFREQNNGLSITVGVDAALVKVNANRGVDIEKFPSVPPKALERAGFDPGEPPLFTYGKIQYPLDFECVQGKRVIKYGQTTGLTKGSIQLKGSMVKRRRAELEKPNGDMVVMKNQYIVESHGGVPFFLLGDSGAGVFLVGENNKLILIGLAIGMLDKDHCVVTPIEYVLQALDLSFKNLQFEEDMDVA